MLGVLRIASISRGHPCSPPPVMHGIGILGTLARRRKIV
jgi:hypothetical protein